SPPPPPSLHDALPIFCLLQGRLRAPSLEQPALVHMESLEALAIAGGEVVVAADAGRQRDRATALDPVHHRKPAHRRQVRRAPRRSEEHTSELQSRVDL